VKLVVLPSPYRELTRPLLKYIKRIERQGAADVITVVLPEFIPAKMVAAHTAQPKLTALEGRAAV
jgi:hypothetical protein